MPKYNTDSVIFSCISGYNYYAPSDAHAGGVIHIPSDTDVSLVDFIYADELSIQMKWKHFIEWPADSRYFIWPIDLVKDTEGNCALVFRKKAYPNFHPFKELLYNDTLLDWQTPAIQKLTKSLLEAMIALHRAGYAYHAFNFNQMYYNTETMDVVINFSTSMSRYYGHPDNNRMELPEICADLEKRGVIWSEPNLPDETAIEFLPPWVNDDNKADMTLNDDYYSIAALLFRLFIGRMPYQGRLMVRNEMADIMNEDRDRDEKEHQRMFSFYHENPVFIFDPNDQNNRIGVFAHELLFVKRWEALPDSVRELFYNAFVPPANNRENWLTKHYEPRQLASPEAWLAVLTREKVI